MSSVIKTDICVIGGGSGGLSVAAGAAQMGANVVLIEGGKMGGDCLNYGCVPSKSLIASAKHAYDVADAGRFGVKAGRAEVDFTAVHDRVHAVIAGIAPHDSVERFESLGVKVIQDYARFISGSQVQAGEHVISARRFVIATGSSPFVPPIPGLEDTPYMTNETIFDLKEAPEHLLVIGGGPIGMELAQAHRRLGSRVTVIEAQRALGKDDPELAAVALRKIRSEGVEILEETVAEEVSATPEGLSVKLSSGEVIAGSHILVAVGRRPNVDSLDLKKADIRTNRAGIEVDSGLKTSNRRVYAIGDVAGGLQFTHVASYHASIILRSALFALPAKASTAHVPWATYTSPEISQVGLTEAAAKEKFGERLEVLRFEYAENDRARAEGHTDGLIKVMVARGRPVGVSIVGAQAGELIGLWSLVLANKLKVSAVAAMIAPYPTLTELSKRAAGQYYVPRLFKSDRVKRIVGLVQRFV